MKGSDDQLVGTRTIASGHEMAIDDFDQIFATFCQRCVMSDK